MSGVIEMRPADGTRFEVRSRDASFVATKTITVRNECNAFEQWVCKPAAPRAPLLALGCHGALSTATGGGAG